MDAEHLGKYQLLEHLASGGMASVYLARLSGLAGFERHVVLKTLRPEAIDDDAKIAMFLDEARLVATLHHQHIAQVFEVGRSDDGSYFLAMEYVHGETIAGVLEVAVERRLGLPLDFGVTVGCAAAAGLHHAHERRGPSGAPLGIVHRDVSPSNVIVSYDGAIKLIDFGIAKATTRTIHTQTGYIKGKLGYMAPEQVRGHAVDRRADVFALGVLVYELTTQTHAFPDCTQLDELERFVREGVVPPRRIVAGYPVELERVILRALELQPEDRYPDAEAMRHALEQAARALDLALGAPAVTRVLGELYGPRPRVEPWLATPRVIEDEPTTPVQQPVIPRQFARGSGEQGSIDDVDPDEIVTHPIDALEPVPRATVPMRVPEPIAPRVATAVRVEVRPVAVPPPIWRPPPWTFVPARPRSPSRRSVIAVSIAISLAIGVAMIAALTGGRHAPPAPELTSSSPSAPLRPASTPITVVPIVPAISPIEAVAHGAPAGQVSLHVVSTPAGATVVLDGVRLGVTPFTGHVPARSGAAVLKLRKHGHLPVKRQVSLEREVTWSATLPRR